MTRAFHYPTLPAENGRPPVRAIPKYTKHFADRQGRVWSNYAGHWSLLKVSHGRVPVRSDVTGKRTSRSPYILAALAWPEFADEITAIPTRNRKNAWRNRASVKAKLAEDPNAYPPEEVNTKVDQHLMWLLAEAVGVMGLEAVADDVDEVPSNIMLWLNGTPVPIELTAEVEYLGACCLAVKHRLDEDDIERVRRLSRDMAA